MTLRLLLFLPLLFSATLDSLAAQNCASVAELRDLLLEQPQAEAERIATWRSSCPGVEDSLSQLYHGLSVSIYQDGGPPRRYIRYAEQALTVQRKLYAAGPAEPLGKSLANLGVFHREAGRPTEALPYLLEADEVFAAIGNTRRRHNNRENLVYVYQANGDYGRAEALLRLMVVAAREEANLLREGETLRLLSVQYNQLGQSEQALPVLDKALAAFETAGSLMGEILTHLEIGRANYLLQRYAPAERATRTALRLAEPYDLFYDRAVLNNQLALILAETGRLPAAAGVAERGLNLARRGGETRAASLLLSTRAEIYALRQEPDAAVAEIRESLELLVPGWQYSEENAVPDAEVLRFSEFKGDVFETLLLLMRYEEQRGANAGAREAVRAADQLADLLRTEFSGEVSKLFWRQQALPLYEAAVRLATAANDPESTYAYFEKGRSLLLLEALLQADVLQRVDPRLSRQIARLKEQLLADRSTLLVKRDTTLADGTPLEERVLAAQDSLTELRQDLAARFPVAADLLLQPELADITTSRQSLVAGGWDRQLHFLFGEDRVYAFTLTATEAFATDLGPSASLAPALRALLKYFTGPALIEQDPEGYLTAAYTVYQQLLEPLAIPAGERLLVLPDGLLAYLPFAALVTSGDAPDLATAPYLIRRHPLSYAQSATVLARQGTAREVTDGRVLAFAPFTEKLPGSSAAALPHTAAELAGLTAAFGLDGSWTATAADRKVLLEQTTNSRVLHLSTHAFATPDGAEPPRILTATEPVYLPDVYGLQLPAELVVLSACQSNIGALAAGEGVLGLGRAFTAAGARGVVASLWRLNDRATADIVTSFYQQLGEGQAKPAALHAAQLNYLERTDLPGYLKSPYYWAGLTYYGDGAGVEAASGIWWWLLALVVAVLMGGGYLARRYS